MRASWLKCFWFWGPPVAWAAAIFVASSISLPPRPPAYPLEDKVIHLLIYLVLALLLFRAFRQDRRQPARQAALLAFLLAAGYGITDELHQAFVAQRHCDALDWLADAAGAALVLLAARRSTAAVPARKETP